MHTQGIASITTSSSAGSTLVIKLWIMIGRILVTCIHGTRQTCEFSLISKISGFGRAIPQSGGMGLVPITCYDRHGRWMDRMTESPGFISKSPGFKSLDG
jgi:hypothetical protein